MIVDTPLGNIPISNIKVNGMDLSGGQELNGLNLKNYIKNFVEVILEFNLYRMSPRSRHFFLVLRTPIFIIISLTQLICKRF